MQVRLVRLKRDLPGLHRDGFRHLSDFQRGILAPHDIHCDGYRPFGQLPETGCVHRQIIRTGQQVRERVVPDVVSLSRQFLCGTDVPN